MHFRKSHQRTDHWDVREAKFSHSTSVSAIYNWGNACCPHQVIV